MARIRGVDMPIDASIPLGVRPPQFDSPLETYGKVEQLNALRAQGQLRDLQMQEFQDKRARQQNLRSILGQGLQGPDLVNALQTGGYLDEATAYAKQLREEQDSSLKREGEIVKLQGDLAKFVMSNPTEQSAIGAIERMEAATGRRFDSERAAVYSMRNDPAALRRWAGGHALSAEQQLPKFQQFDTGGQVQMGTVSPFGEYAQTGAIDKTVTPDALMTDKRTREEGAANRAVTVRGQNMTDSRAREAAAREAEKLKFEREQGKASDIQWDSDRGVLINKRTKEVFKPEGIAGSMPKLTEGQAKAFMFGNRALEADRIISGMVDKNGEPTYSPMAINAKESASNVPLVGGALGYVANKAIGENEQKVEQAQRDFINAVLRQESGAVIADAEFNNARKQYFPQPGDSKAVIEQKRQNRQRAIEGFKVGAGPASGMIGDAPNTVQTDSLPDPAQYPGAVMRDDQTGMRYQSDGKSWRRL